MKHMTHVTTLIVSVLLTATAVFPLQASADEEQQMKFEMVVIANQAFGDLVSNGKYELAVRRITGRRNFAPYATATNLCAALTKLGKYDQAEPRCDAAIKLAEKQPVPAPRGWKGINQVAAQRAVAYSNRGVMHILRGNESGAEKDFVTAIERKADLGAPTRNLAKANVDSTARAVAIVSN